MADKDPEITADPDAMSEGELRRLRDNAGLTQVAGHEATIHEWENSPAGQEWLKGAEDREADIQKQDADVEESAKKPQKAMEEYLDALNTTRSSSSSSSSSSGDGGLESMTKAELLEEAQRRGVDANQTNTKQEIIDSINAG